MSTKLSEGDLAIEPENHSFPLAQPVHFSNWFTVLCFIKGTGSSYFPALEQRSICSFQCTGTPEGPRMTDSVLESSVFLRKYLDGSVYASWSQTVLTASLPWFLFV